MRSRNLSRLLADYGDRLDAAFIISPHAYHYDHPRACLEAGLDVLLEKPMVGIVDANPTPNLRLLDIVPLLH